MKNALPALHVLVVEDDPDIQTAMCCILEDEGHHADCAESVEAGAEKLLGATYDVIVLDWMLGGQTAEVLLPTITTLDPVPPAILYSAAPSAAALAKKWSIEFVSKPFDVNTLLSLLSGCVAARTSIPAIPT